MRLRKLVRKIRFRPLGNLKRAIQENLYSAISLIGILMQSKNKFVSPDFKNILILRPDRIGDVILATPVLKILKEHLPSSYIAILIDEKNKDLITGNPYLDEIFTIRHKGITGLFLNKQLIRQLKDKRFDLAIVLYPTFWCGLLALLCDIPYRLGYPHHGNGFLFNLKPSIKYEEVSKHEVEINLDLLRQIGIEPINPQLWVSVKEVSEKNIDSFLAKHHIQPQDKLVLIHPGAYEEYKRWMPQGFAKIAGRIITDYGAKVIILGGPGEEGLVEETVNLMSAKPITALKLTLSESISLIRRAKLFIGNSTGTMHIAAALKIPVVAIFGNIHPLDSYVKWAPFGTKHSIVHRDIGCIDCQPSDCRRYRCMEAISPEEVLAVADKFLKKI